MASGGGIDLGAALFYQLEGLVYGLLRVWSSYEFFIVH